MGTCVVNKRLEQFNEFLYNRKVAFVGVDRQTIPIIDYFHRHNAKITIYDYRALEELDANIVERIINYNIIFSLSDKKLKNLSQAEFIVKSSSYRPDQKAFLEAESRGVIVVSIQDLIIELCSCKVIGIVGGYNVDIVYLLCNILPELGFKCYLDDNPRRPLLCRLNEIDKNSIIILPINEKELFSLKYIPDISIVDNICSSVDEKFMTYGEYLEAIRIFSNRQMCKGRLIFNADTDFDDNYILNNSNVILYSSNKRLNNGVIYDNNIIKLCDDGIRRHFMNISINKFETGEISNICAVIACLINLVDNNMQVREFIKKSL